MPLISFAEAGLSFRQAASEGNLPELIRLYNEYGKEILEQFGAKSGKTALHQAAMKNKEKIVEMLIGWGANLNCKDALGNTPLILAYQKQSFEVANYLLEQDNVDILHKNNQGKNALMMLVPESKAKFSLLQDKFRKKMTSQVRKLVENGSRIQGIDVKSDGDIELIGYDVDVKQLTQRAAESAQIYLSSQEEDIRILKNEEGINPNILDKHNFKIPPLVFLMSHSDPASFDLLKRNFNELKQFGYKAICLEFDSDKSLEKALLDLIETKNSIEMKPVDRKIAALHEDFIKSFVDAGFNYHGVDAPLGILRNSDFYSLLVSKAGMKVRNSHIAKMVAKYAEQYSGGIVILIGTAHCVFLEALKIHNKGTTDPFVVYQVYSKQSRAFIPVSESLEEKLLRLNITGNSDIVSIDSSKLNEAEQQEKFVQPIIEFLEHDVPTRHYSQQVDTQLVRKLQLLHSEFKGMLREVGEEESAEWIVDAVLSVPDSKIYKLQALVFKEIMGITTNLRYAHNKGETHLSLVVENINSSPNNELINKLKH